VKWLVFFVVAAGLSGRDVRVHTARRVVTLDLEDYVGGVLAGEAATFTSAEALKAMAVASRTFAVHHLRRHGAEGFDFCDTTHCQNLRLNAGGRDDLQNAVTSTESELLWYDGRAAAAYYHGHCGGTTAAGDEVWPGIRAPYLRSVPDTFCLARGRAEWKAELASKDPIRITRRSPTGRVMEVSVAGKPMPAERFQMYAAVLRSNAYSVRATGSGVQVSGFGRGHGVGLCQIGGEERGKAGHSYASILAFYYPGTKLGIAASGVRWTYAAGERVDAFATDASAAREITSAADRALVEAEAIAGLSARKRPQVRAYPTLSIYRDATGSSGAIAATTSGFTVRTQPVGLLRSRNVLRSTLLHEMLHVLIDSHAHPQLPDWYAEGLALYLSATSPPRNTAHAHAAARVRALANRHGRATLLNWVSAGVPAAAQSTRIPTAQQR
jgi:stage II sporulation protein D